MKNFDGFGLNPVLMQSLTQMDYTTSTPIQAQAIPLALKGRDIMGSAQTGTGKTAAFAIPLVQHLLDNPHGGALVLTPTRELGKQVMEIIHQLLGRKSKIKSAFIIGGESMNRQFMQLKKNPQLIVGTPGRINDHLERGTLKLNKADFLVLDETDRMLDMGFSVQLDRIFKYLPKQRQTLMFSATLPDNILKISQKYLNKPERISVGSTTTPIDSIKQELIHIKHEEKYEELVYQLNARKGTILVFVKTKYGTEKMAKRLNKKGFDVEAIHGDLKQSRRARVIKGLRDKKYRILIATDVVARGLDIPHIEHVINYDLPQVAEDYIHRIGRTARAGAEGNALCFVSPQEQDKWDDIECLMFPELKKERDAKRRARPKGKKGKPRNNSSRGRRSGKKPKPKTTGKRFDGAKRGGNKRKRKARAA